MRDVPEGGGPPSAQLLTSGRSNDIVPDISEESRTSGRVEIYQIFGLLRNTDTAMMLGGNVIIGEPPADPNVSITLLSLKDPFATRAKIAQRIESGMSAGSEISGYLLEAAYATMRAIQVFQRPGAAVPAIGKTFVLVYNEGLSSERRQRVRIKNVDVQTRVHSELLGGTLIDFPAQVVTCELFDGLQFDFPGSPPSRLFGRQADKTRIRETVYADSGMFYGASRLTKATQINDSWLEAASIYTQIVPNSRTEAPIVDARPGAQLTLTLATAPRLIEVGVTPHSQRIKINDVNAGLTFVAQLTPLPEPGTTVIVYFSMGNRYQLRDDGTGRITGSGGGAVSFLTGALNFTLQAVPDIGSQIAISHGSKIAYTDRSGQGAAVRQPEYTFVLDGDAPTDQVVPGSLLIEYTSANTAYVVSDDGNGKLTGDATGLVDYASRTVLMRPSHMPDAGAEFAIDCQLDNTVTEIFSGLTPDAAGFVQINLAQQPAGKSLQLQWATARSTSSSSGGNLTETNTMKQADTTYTIKSVPEYHVPVPDAVVPPGAGFVPNINPNWFAASNV